MKILISGAGIAGPALAYWLAHFGHEPTIVEIAPELRAGGYVIDFWGAGFELAERMNLLPELMAKGYMIQELRVVNRRGKRIAAFPTSAFARATQGRYISLPRSELSAALFRAVEHKVETIFGDTIAAIDQTADRVHVTFDRSPARDFDLVVGADGLHSHVRALAFGPENQFEEYLGCKVAAFQAESYRPRNDLVYVMFTEVGQQVGRFSMRDDRALFLFTFADPAKDEGHSLDVKQQRAVLHHRFGRSGWECPKILQALDATPDLYFDRVSQIRMPSRDGQRRWSRGRVVLIGDAAFCVSLLAGQGSALAMIAAYVLAGELHRASGDHALALSRYEQLLVPFIQHKQKAALRFVNFFAPPSRFSIFLRNQTINLMRLPWVADLAVGRDIADRIALPNYDIP